MKKREAGKRPSRARPKFLIDGMLGSLTRKLRILGFDSVYDKVSSDTELIEKARATERYLITSDIELFLNAKRLKAKSILIRHRDEEGRLLELFSKLGKEEFSLPRMSRCSVCNGTLSKTGRVTHTGKVIYVCAACGKNYWKGSHWAKLGFLFRNVSKKLAEIGAD